jgi:hypothetical protein
MSFEKKETPMPENNDQEEVLIFTSDLNTGESVPLPEAPDMAWVDELLREARNNHGLLVAREASVVERQHRAAQLWLAAVALCSAAGMFGGHPGDLWLAFGFACGFALSVLLTGPQPASLTGFPFQAFMTDEMLGRGAHSRLVLLSTWQEIILLAQVALQRRVIRFGISVWLLAAFAPLALLSRILTLG